MASFWDAITGKAAEDAAEANRQAANEAYVRGTNIAGGYQTGALGQIGEGLTSATGTLGTGLTNQVGALNTGLTNQVGALGQAAGAYAPLSQLGQTYGGAVDAYMAALGLKGKDAQQASFANYTQSPGVQFAIDQATKAAANKAASLGVAGGGNTLDAISELARGRTMQDYSTNYLDRLAGFVNPQLAAVTGAAQGTSGVYKTLADTYGANAGALANAYGANAGTLAGLQYGAGESGANVLGNVAGLKTQASQGLGAGLTAANNLEYQGAQNAANFWGNLAGKAIGAAGSIWNPAGAAAGAAGR